MKTRQFKNITVKSSPPKEQPAGGCSPAAGSGADAAPC